MKPNLLHLALAGMLALTPTLRAQEAATDEKAQTAELAKKLSNPVASLISVPIQNNWDFGIGPANAMRYTANIQPVIPFPLSDDWNLITRTILPIIYAESPVQGGTDKSGLGDVVQSFFFSPKAPVGGWILAAGPVLLWPTATDPALGFGKWGAGPTALALQQKNGWTYGLLANHLWSYAEAGRYSASSADDASDGSGAQVNATFIQPFVSFTTRTFTTFGLNTESTYDWSHSQWTVPLNVNVSQLLKVGKQPIQFALGLKYYAERPIDGPDWGLRFAVTFLFPK
ncbi:MAG: transporter [Limisphaerales bacterium]